MTSRDKPLRGVLASLSLPLLLSALGTSIANVALPTLALAFDASFQEILCCGSSVPSSREAEAGS